MSIEFSESFQLFWGIRWGLQQKRETQHGKNQGGGDAQFFNYSILARVRSHTLLKYAVTFHLFSVGVTKKQQAHKVLKPNSDFFMMQFTLEKSTQGKRPAPVSGNLEILSLRIIVMN